MMICMGLKGVCGKSNLFMNDCWWWVVVYVKVGRFILFFMTTLITITRQSPNTTNNNYLSHSKIFGCKKKEFLSSRSTPLHFLFLSHFPLELFVVTTPLSLKTKLIIINKFLNYKYNQIFPLLFFQIFLVFLFNHQSIESNQLTNQSINRQKEKSFSIYLLLLYLLFSLLFFCNHSQKFIHVGFYNHITFTNSYF